ncbi:MAG TPA: hypothetical protein VF533_06655 [Solirubrobacteraceae bacterium]|jgi:hypothetical protein
MAEEQDQEHAQETGADEGQSEGEKAAQHEQESEEAKEEMKKLEEDPPDRLEDWPGGKAKYETFGGASEDTGYEEGATAKLGPSGLRRFEDGSIEIDGEKVDNPDDYKGEPIPGGPTDPDAPAEPGEEESGDEEGTTDDDGEGKDE